jgi:hypothetical protein
LQLIGCLRYCYIKVRRICVVDSTQYLPYHKNRSFFLISSIKKLHVTLDWKDAPPLCDVYTCRIRCSHVCIIGRTKVSSSVLVFNIKPYLHIFLAVTDFKVNDTIYVLSINIKIRKPLGFLSMNLFTNTIMKGT